MENTEELQDILRSLLISNPKVTSASRLLRDYEETEGRQFPFRKLGFSSFIDYLKSIPSVVKLVDYYSPNPDVIPIVTTESCHIDKLVSKQKITAPRKNNSFFNRRGRYNGRQTGTIPPRRRPRYNYPTPHLSNTSSNKGVNVKDIDTLLKENYGREDLTKNGINSTNDLLKHANDMVENVDGRLWPKMSSLQDFTAVGSSHGSEILNNNRCMPAGSEDDFDFKTNLEDNDFWESISEEDLSNYTIEHCTQSLLGNIIYDNPPLRKESEENEDEYEPFNISERMIKNFQIILERHPEGVYASQLQDKYSEEFHVTLDIQELGFSSVITLASYLPKVFTYERVSSYDWKLFDARSVKQVEPLYNEDNSPDSYKEMDDYVPKSILDNVEKLVKLHPEGFRSTSLVSLYERDIKKTLDFEALGFAKLGDFIKVLKKVITVRAVKDYHLLLPKHFVMPVESVEPNKSPEVLKVSGWSLGSAPDNVMGWNDTIEVQNVPPVNKNAKRNNEPLIEMEIRVAEVMSPDLFYVMLDSKYNELQNLMDDLDKFYKMEGSSYRITKPYIYKNLVCACMYDGCWHRAKIVSSDDTSDTVKIKYIDYGTPGVSEISELCFLQKEFGKLPSQAICAKLAGIRPPKNANKYSKAACQEFLKLVTEKRLFAYVYHVGKKENEGGIQLEMLLYDTNGPKEFLINECLVEKKLADFMYHIEDTQEKQVVESLETNSASSHPSSHLVQPKRQLGPPPGFETHQVETSIPNQSTFYRPNYSSQANSNFLPTYPTQHQQQLQYPNFYNPFPQPPPHPMYPSFVQNNQFINLPPIGFDSHHLFNFLPNNVMLQTPPFSSSFTPPFSPQIPCIPPNPIRYITPPNQTQYTSQNVTPYSQATHVKSPCVEERNTSPSQSPYCNGFICDKIHELSSDTSLPRQPISSQHQSVQQNTELYLHVEENIDAEQYKENQNYSPQSSTATSHKSEFDNTISRPDTPLSHTSAEVAGIHTQINDVSQMVSNFSGSRPKSEAKSIQNNEPMSYDRCFEDINDSSLDLRLLLSPDHINMTSKNDKFSCTAEFGMNNIQPTPTKSLVKNMILPSDNSRNTTNETIPDNWEDLELDEIPAKSDNFIEDFKSPLDVLLKNNQNEQSKTSTSPNLFSKTNAFENNICLPLNIKTEFPINWKNVFDPDASTEIQRSKEKTALEKCPRKFNVKKTLVQRFEILNKSFHLIYVNGKLAVLCYEFYTQFTLFSIQTISKILETKNKKQFTLILKGEHPTLFSELEKLEFPAKVKRNVLKLGKTMISYISEVSEVFSMLKVENKLLLDELKKISEEFNVCLKSP